MEHKAAVDVNPKNCFINVAEGDAINGNEGMHTLATPVGRKRNPMEIAGVLDCVFGFLPLYDIKSCRLVSKEWNHVAEPFSRKLSRISFGSCNTITSDRSFSNFINVFKTSGTQRPFTAFGIKKYKYKTLHWPQESLMEIFEKLGPTTKDLKIDDGLKIKGPVRRIKDFPKLLSASQITALDVTTSLTGYQDFSFPLDRIVNVKYLRLTGCSVRLINGIRISPIEISLHKCQILFPDESSDCITNEFISFENTKVCIVQCSRYWRGWFNRNICLDLSGNAELETLNLSRLTLCNWGISNWKVKNLYLESISGEMGSSLIHVSSMEITSCNMSLLGIPETVEVLSLNDQSFNENPTQFVSLPNLKILKISFCRLNELSDNFYRFVRLIRGPNLEALEINCPDSYNIVHNLVLTEIPSRFKKVKINGKNIKCSGEFSTQLETIVLTGLSIPSILDIMPRVKSHQNVVLFCNPCTGRSFKNNAEGLQYLQKPYKSFAIGPFHWCDWFPEKLTTTKLEKLVNEKFQYYLFKDKKMSGIEKGEFEELMEL